MPDSVQWKVLMVEDDRIDREIFRRSLTESIAYGFDCQACDTAGRGIDLARTWEPDCILLDFNLPDMDGLEALEILRGANPLPPCAVIMLTACGGEELAVQALKNGAMDYIPKGQMVREILPHSIANAIERFRMQRRIEEQTAALEKSARQYETLLEAVPHMVWVANPHGCVEYANRQWFEYCGLGLGQGGPLGWERLLYPEDRERSWAAWNQARQSGTAFEIEHRLRRADGAYRWHLVRAVPFRGTSGEIVNWFGTCTEIENQKQAETVNLQKEKHQGIGRLAAGVAHDFNNLLVSIMGGASLAMDTIENQHPAQELLRGVVSAAERAAELTGKMLAYAGKGNMCIERTDLNQVVSEACEAVTALIPRGIRLSVRPGRPLPPLTTDWRRLRQAVLDLLWNAVEAIGENNTGMIWVRTSAVDVPPDSPRTLPAGRYVVLEVRDTGCGMNEETRKRIFDPFFSTKFQGRGLGLAAVQGFVRSAGGEVQVESKPGKGARFRILLPAMSAEATAVGSRVETAS